MEKVEALTRSESICYVLKYQAIGLGRTYWVELAQTVSDPILFDETIAQLNKMGRESIIMKRTIIDEAI